MPNFLVETATRKKPPPGELGTDEAVMTVGGQGDGHVPRNIRLMLAGIDLLEPYIQVASATAGSVDLLGKPESELMMSAGTTIAVS